MPPKALVDWQQQPRDALLMNRAAVAEILPHRFEMALVDGVYAHDREKHMVTGFLEVREEAFWARGHFPELAVLPGVLMIEAAAQLCTVLHVLRTDDRRILGLAALRDVTYRGHVTPPGRFDLVVQSQDAKPSLMRARFHVQGYYKGKLVMDGKVLGMPLRG